MSFGLYDAEHKLPISLKIFGLNLSEDIKMLPHICGAHFIVYSQAYRPTHSCIYYYLLYLFLSSTVGLGEYGH